MPSSSISERKYVLTSHHSGPYPSSVPGWSLPGVLCPSSPNYLWQHLFISLVSTASSLGSPPSSTWERQQVSPPSCPLLDMYFYFTCRQTASSPKPPVASSCARLLPVSTWLNPTELALDWQSMGRFLIFYQWSFHFRCFIYKVMVTASFRLGDDAMGYSGAVVLIRQHVCNSTQSSPLGTSQGTQEQCWWVSGEAGQKPLSNQAASLSHILSL